MADDILGPNGLAFSPDESILYTVESRGVPTRKILAYDMDPDGVTLHNKRVLIDAGPGTPDGFRVDVEGNLWCGWGMGSADLDGVMVFASDGTPIGRIVLPELVLLFRPDCSQVKVGQGFLSGCNSHGFSSVCMDLIRGQDAMGRVGPLGVVIGQPSTDTLPGL